MVVSADVLKKPEPSLRILFVGSQWHGSDSTGLARGLRRLGHAVFTVDDDAYLPPGRSLAMRAFRRLCRPSLERAYNAAIVADAADLRPNLLVVCKGANVRPETILAVKRLGIYATCFYPDVSMTAHGGNIPRCIPLYDWVFTSKSFGLRDLKERFGVERCSLLHHGADLECHRPLGMDAGVGTLASDCCFVGTWSPKKEQLLLALIRDLPQVNLRIWCAQWKRFGSAELQPYVTGRDVFGDAYAAVVHCAKINLGLLSEIRPGASSGDLVTARTFQIPACGAFMLHERTDELAQFFTEGEEVACFANGKEMVNKVVYYLEHEEERERMRLAAYRRCVAEDGLEKRAEKIVAHYRSIGAS